MLATCSSWVSPNECVIGTSSGAVVRADLKSRTREIFLPGNMFNRFVDRVIAGRDAPAVVQIGAALLETGRRTKCFALALYEDLSARLWNLQDRTEETLSALDAPLRSEFGLGRRDEMAAQSAGSRIVLFPKRGEEGRAGSGYLPRAARAS